MEQIPFQIEAVDKLVANIKRLWGHGDCQIPVVLKAPTGSGKTIYSEDDLRDGRTARLG